MVRMIFACSYDKNRGDKIAKIRPERRPSEKMIHFPKSAFLKIFAIYGVNFQKKWSKNALTRYKFGHRGFRNAKGWLPKSEFFAFLSALNKNEYFEKS